MRLILILSVVLFGLNITGCKLDRDKINQKYSEHYLWCDDNLNEVNPEDYKECFKQADRLYAEAEDVVKNRRTERGIDLKPAFIKLVKWVEFCQDRYEPPKLVYIPIPNTSLETNIGTVVQSSSDKSEWSVVNEKVSNWKICVAQGWALYKKVTGPRNKNRN